MGDISFHPTECCIAAMPPAIPPLSPKFTPPGPGSRALKIERVNCIGYHATVSITSSLSSAIVVAVGAADPTYQASFAVALTVVYFAFLQKEESRQGRPPSTSGS